MNRQRLWPAIFGVLSCPIFPAAAQACAVCLTGIAGEDPMTDAFNWSVLFLMAMPYLVVGSIGGWLFYAHWRAKVKRDGEPRKTAPVVCLAWTHKGSGR